MQMGLPIITSKVGGNEELIKNTTARIGILVPRENLNQLKKSILFLYKNKKIRQSYAEASQKEAFKYSANILIDQYITFYINCLSSE